MTQSLSNDDYADRMREQRGEPRLIRLPAVITGAMVQADRLAKFHEQWEAMMRKAVPRRRPTLKGIKETVEAMPGVESAEVTETSPGVVEIITTVRQPTFFSKTIRLPPSSVPLP